MTQTIAVAHHAGGVGKTTTTLNLAYSLAQAHRSVLCVDLDPQGDLSDRLGVEPEGTTLRHSLTGSNPLPPTILYIERGGFDLIPASLETMSGIEIELTQAQRREERLRRALAPYAARYDYILIDCPPTLGLLTINALYAADTLLIPVQAQPKAFRHLRAFLPALEEARANRDGEHPTLLGLLLTMLPSPLTTNARDVDSSLRAKFGPAVFTTTIPQRTAAQSDSGYQAPVGWFAPENGTAKAYAALAAEVITRVEAPDAQTR